MKILLTCRFAALFLLVGILELAVAPTVRAQANLVADVVAGGGGMSASDEFRLQGTVGLTAPGTLASEVHVVRGGFWPQVHTAAEPIAIPAVQQDAVTTDEDAPLAIRPLQNDTDPAGGSLTIDSFTEPANGAVEQTGDGELTYTPTENFHGEDSFSYTAANADGGAASADVVITVNPVNDAPAFTSEPLTSAAVGEDYLYEMSAGDVDGDALTFSASTLPSWLNFTDLGEGMGRLEGTPANEAAGDHDVVLAVGDAEATAEQTFTITVVLGAPAAPMLAAPADGSTDVETDLSLEWSDVAGAATYHVQLAADEAFTTVIVDSSGVLETTLDIANLAYETTYFWQVRAVNAAGESDFAGPFSFTTLSNVSAEEAEVPDRFELRQNYPNPFNPSTTIGFDLPTAADVRLVVYDLFGREVAVLASGRYPAGRHEVHADLASLASGSYFYRVEAGEYRALRRMLLVR